MLIKIKNDSICFELSLPSHTRADISYRDNLNRSQSYGYDKTDYIFNDKRLLDDKHF